MKAKDYAMEYMKNPCIENLRKLSVKFWEEGAELEKKRNIQTEPALFALFNELDQKWRAFCRELPEGHFLHPSENFVPNFLQEVRPEIYQRWLKYREATRPVYIPLEGKDK